MDWLSGVGSVITAGANAIMQQESINKAERASDKALQLQKEIADKNYEMQQKQYDYQRELNDLTMSREDSAVQRRVADLKAAGLNPVLAAGSSASSQSFRTGTAPQLDSSHFGAYADRAIRNADLGLSSRLGFMNLALDFVRQRADISRSEAETALLNERANTMRAERPLNLENMSLANSFLEQSFKVNLDQKYANLSATEKENILRNKKAELLDKNIDYEQVRYLLGYADWRLKDKNLDKIDKELLVMDSLLKARQMEYDINEWNFKYFKDRSLPTTYRDPSEVKIFKSILGELGWGNGDDGPSSFDTWASEHNPFDFTVREKNKRKYQEMVDEYGDKPFFDYDEAYGPYSGFRNPFKGGFLWRLFSRR